MFLYWADILIIIMVVTLSQSLYNARYDTVTIFPHFTVKETGSEKTTLSVVS